MRAEQTRTAGGKAPKGKYAQRVAMYYRATGHKVRGRDGVHNELFGHAARDFSRQPRFFTSYSVRVCMHLQEVTFDEAEQFLLRFAAGEVQECDTTPKSKRRIESGPFKGCRKFDVVKQVMHALQHEMQVSTCVTCHIDEARTCIVAC